MPAPETSIALGLGSNLGRRERQLVSAVRALGAFVDDIEVGGLYESEPLVAPSGSHSIEQRRYLNTALTGRTRLPPEPLLAALKFLERDAGRRRAERWAPRPLDLDLLLYGDEISTARELTLPHPGLRHRPFVLAPLADVAPELRVPPAGETVADLLAALDLAGPHLAGPHLAGIECQGLERLDWTEPPTAALRPATAILRGDLEAPTPPKESP